MKTFALITFFVASLHVGFGADFQVPLFIQHSEQDIAPFFVHKTLGPSLRYQQVYQASGFLGLGTSQFLINELVFAPDGLSPDASVVLPNIRIDLSTTSKAPDGLSTVFAENVGANDTVVYSGSLNYFQTGLGNYHIHLQTPFLFDPTAGNLLMDVRNFQPLPSTLAQAYNEAEVTFGDSTSSVAAIDVNALTGTTSTAGLRTGIAGTLVPEPSTWALLLASGALCAWVARRRVGGARIAVKQR